MSSRLIQGKTETNGKYHHVASFGTIKTKVWIGPMVKHQWNVAICVRSRFFTYSITTTTFHLGWYFCSYPFTNELRNRLVHDATVTPVIHDRPFFLGSTRLLLFTSSFEEAAEGDSLTVESAGREHVQRLTALGFKPLENCANLKLSTLGCANFGFT